MGETPAAPTLFHDGADAEEQALAVIQELMDLAIDPDDIDEEMVRDYSIARASGYNLQEAYRIAAGHAWRLYFEDRQIGATVEAMKAHIAYCQQRLAAEEGRFNGRRMWRLKGLFYGFIRPFKSFFKGKQSSVLLPGGIKIKWRENPTLNAWRDDPETGASLAEEFVRTLPPSLQMEFFEFVPKLRVTELKKAISYDKETGVYTFRHVDEVGVVTECVAAVKRPSLDSGEVDLPIMYRRQPAEPFSYDIALDASAPVTLTTAPEPAKAEPEDTAPTEA